MTMTASGPHLPWCSGGCAGVVTSVHESRPVPVFARDTDVVGLTVAVEQLAEAAPPLTLVVLELVQDNEVVQYRLPLGQVRALQHALRGALRRLAHA